MAIVISVVFRLARCRRVRRLSPVTRHRGGGAEMRPAHTANGAIYPVFKTLY